MSTLRGGVKVEVAVTLLLNEDEIRALHAITGYGAEPFLKCFYTHMGSSYLQPHEAGLRSLFDTVYKEAPRIYGAADKARAILKVEL